MHELFGGKAGENVDDLPEVPGQEVRHSNLTNGCREGSIAFTKLLMPISVPYVEHSPSSI